MMTESTLTRIGTMVLALLVSVTAKSAETKLDIRLDNAALSITSLQKPLDGGIASGMLTRSAGVVIVPQLLKAGFGVGGSYGKGVLVRRSPDGAWQPPVFVTVSGGSFGWQAGIQALELLLVFRTDDALNRLMTSGLTLGADVAVTAGPLGRRAGAASDFATDAPIYSYARGEGLFLGVSLDGLAIRIEQQRNTAYYAAAGYAPPSSNRIDPSLLPASAKRLLALLPAAESGARQSTQGAEERHTESGDGALKTFGLGEAPLDEQTTR